MFRQSLQKIIKTSPDREIRQQHRFSSAAKVIKKNLSALKRFLGQKHLRRFSIGQPGDRFEQEADQMAGRPNGNLNVLEKVPAQITPMRSSPQNKSDTVPPIVRSVLNSSGQKIETNTKNIMGDRFGQDFSRVKIHTDAKAAESAREVDALAYTVGNDIVFGAGQYRPNTAQGQKLLMHELTHVVQQGTAQPPQIIQRQTTGVVTGERSLTIDEQSAARSVFMDSLDLSKIKIDYGGIWTIGGYTRVSPDRTIHFSSNNFTLKFLMHELTHCWQYQHGVSMAAIISGAISQDYDYGGELGLLMAYRNNKHFLEFNTEEQGEIVEDYYDRVTKGQNVDAWIPYINCVRFGDFATPPIGGVRPGGWTPTSQ